MVSGTKLTHQLYVDISRKQRRASDPHLRSRKLKRRDYKRFYLYHERHNNRDANDERRMTSRNSRKSNVIKRGKNSYYVV